MSVEAKRQELQAIRDQISQIDPSSSAYATLKAQEAALEAEISDLKTAALEDKVQAEAVPFTVAGIDIQGLPVEVIALIEDVVKTDRRRLLNEQAIELEQIENVAESAKQELTTKLKDTEALNEALEDLIDARNAENAQLSNEVQQGRDRIAQLQRDNEDLESKLANAAAQLSEKDAEIARLNSQIDDYQKAKAFGEREAQSIIDVSAEERESIQAKVEAVRKLYTHVEDWGSRLQVFKPEGGFDLVKRDEFEAEYQPVAPPALPGGSNDSATFLGSDQADHTDSQGDTALPAMEVSQFPTESAESELATHTAVHEDNAEEAVSRAEFEALKERVAKLEQGEVKEAA